MREGARTASAKDRTNAVASDVFRSTFALLKTSMRHRLRLTAKGVGYLPPRPAVCQGQPPLTPHSLTYSLSPSPSSFATVGPCLSSTAARCQSHNPSQTPG